MYQKSIIFLSSTLLSLPILFTAFVIQVNAQPSINSVTGTILDGGRAVIKGNSFGSKSPAAPMFTTDFEEGADGAYLHDVDRDNWTNRYDGAEYSNDTAFSGSLSSHNYVKDGDQGTGEGFDSSYHTFSPSTEVYVTYMFKHNGTSYTSGVEKLSRLTAAGSTYNGTGMIALSDSYIFYNPGTGYIYPKTDDDGEGRNFTSSDYSNPSDWTRIQMHAKYSDPGGTANGLIHVTVGSEDKRYANIVTRASGQTFQFTQFLLGLMHDEDSLSSGAYHHMYIDDVYIDNTPARVELCSSSTWDGGSSCVPQSPTAWAASEISVTINAGAFSENERGYVYVVDKDGIVNRDGFPVIIGGSSEVPIAESLGAPGELKEQ